MTAARDRPAERRRLEWDECSLQPDRARVPWWLAISLALGLTALGVFADIQRLNRLGIVFQACYFVGCLLAVSLVARKGLFGPMVQPPLILAVAVPGVVLSAGSLPTSAGAAATALAVGTPLINGFPTMAITTGFTLAIGIFRLLTQRPPTRSLRSGAKPPPAKPAPAMPTGKSRPALDDDEPVTAPIPRQPPHP
ncbi:MAG: DUF6542 domain-containing protein [Pseudonocardiaceae bacterium]